MSEGKMFLKRTEVARILGVERHAVTRLVKAGTLPEPVRFGPRTERWKTADILALAGARGD